MADSILQKDWLAAAVKLFGRDPMTWAFKCPVCGHIATTQEYKDAGAPQGAVGFSCIGRWTQGKDAFSEDGEGPCNYAGGGLLRLNPVKVELPDGTVKDAFEFGVAP